MNLGTWIQELVLKTDGFSSGVRTATASGEQLKATVSKSLGDVTKSLGLDLKEFAEKIAPVFGPLSSQFEGLVGKLSGVSAGFFGVAVGAVAAGKWARDALKEIGSLGKQAERLGASIEGMQRISVAGAMKGLDTDTLTFALDRFQRTLGEARESLALGKSNGFTTTLMQLGIEARDFVNLSPDVAFQQLAGALANVSNTSDRTAIATSIFGRQARTMMEVLASGNTIFDAAQTRIDLFGTALSKADTAKAREATKALGMAASAVSMTYEGLKNSIALALAPAVTAVAKAFEEVVITIQPIVGAIRDIFAGVGVVIKNAVRIVSVVLKAVWPVVREFVAAFKWLWEGVTQLAGLIVEGLEWIWEQIGTGVEFLWEGIKAGFAAVRIVAQTVEEVFVGVINTLTLGFARLETSAERIARIEATTAAAVNAGALQDLDRMMRIHDARERMRRAGAFALIDGASIQQQINAFRGAFERLRLPGTAGRDSPIHAEIQKDIDALRERIALFGLDENAQQIWRMRQQRARPEDIERLAGLQALMKRAELQKKIDDDLQERIDQSQRTFTINQAFDPTQSAGVREQALRAAEREAQFQDQINKLIREGATEARLANTRRQQARQTEFDDLRALQQRMQSVLQSVQSPVDNFRDRLRDLDAGLQAGALTKDQHALGIAQAFQELDKSMPQWENPRALQAGSTEAASAISRAVRESRQVDQAERMRLILESQQRVQEEQLRVAREIRDAALANQIRAADI